MAPWDYKDEDMDSPYSMGRSDFVDDDYDDDFDFNDDFEDPDFNYGESDDGYDYDDDDYDDEEENGWNLADDGEMHDEWEDDEDVPMSDWEEVSPIDLSYRNRSMDSISEAADEYRRSAAQEREQRFMDRGMVDERGGLMRRDRGYMPRRGRGGRDMRG